MFEVFQASESSATKRRAFFQCVDATDGITPETGLTGVGRFSKNGAATSATSAGITEIDSTNMPGRYYVEFTAVELDTAGQFVFRYKNAACAEVIVQCTIVSFDPYAAGPTVATITSAIWDEPRASHAIAGSFGQGAASVQGNVTGSVASVTGAVGSVTGGVGGSVAGSVASVTAVGAGAITAASHAANAIDASALATDAVTEIVTAVFARAFSAAYGSYTFDEMIKLMASVLHGKVSGLATGAPIFRNLADSANVVSATTDADGNRSAVTRVP